MNDNPKKVGIVGYGEVGKAIASFYEDPFIEDLNGPHIAADVDIDVLHICIPFVNPDAFEAAVKPHILSYGRNALVIVHSTVAVGTTARIGDYHRRVVHAPIRGVHPHLARGIKVFPMYVGADDLEVGKEADAHLEEIGIRPVLVEKSAATELLKLLDTTYYGICIAYHAYAKQLCDYLGVDFDAVMTDANVDYNEGYQQLGKPNVVRPVLFPPEGGTIGGHCVIPNAEILRAEFGDDAILQAILRHK